MSNNRLEIFYVQISYGTEHQALTVQYSTLHDQENEAKLAQQKWKHKQFQIIV